MIHYDPNGIQASDYEHPADREALAILKKIPGIDKIVAMFLDFSIKSSDYQKTSMDCFRVTEKTYPRLYSLYQKALDRLNMDTEPKLFVANAYEYNGYTTGVNAPYIVLNFSSIADATDDEILYLIGHELGHVNSGHMLYHGLVNMIFDLVSGKVSLPPILTKGFMYALYDWYRKSELTADRAGIIAAGGADAPIAYKLRTIGKTPENRYVDFSPEKIKQQEEALAGLKESLSGKAIYLMILSLRTHPVTIERIYQARQWVQTEEYKKLTSGIK